LKHALHLAVEWDYLEASPAARVKKFKEPPGRVRYLTRDEAVRLIAVCSDELRPVVVALYTGIRLGEILALEWRHVDLKRRQLRVVDSKNNETRVVPMNDVLYNTIASLRRRDGKVFLSRYNRPYCSVKSGFEAAPEKRYKVESYWVTINVKGEGNETQGIFNGCGFGAGGHRGLRSLGLRRPMGQARYG